MWQIFYYSPVHHLLGKSERTREFVMNGLQSIQQIIYEKHNLRSNIRLETYPGDQYFHLPPQP